jgi:hypothetical protein
MELQVVLVHQSPQLLLIKEGKSVYDVSTAISLLTL